MQSILFGTDETVISMLRQPQHIGVIGVSRKPHRASYRVTEFLIDHGYQVSLINPVLAGSTLFDREVYANVAAATQAQGRLDWVDVFRAPEHLSGILDEVMANGVGGIWGQLEVMDASVAQVAIDAGLRVVMDRCPAIEYPRFRAKLI